jgi:hypothetical protein
MITSSNKALEPTAAALTRIFNSQSSIAQTGTPHSAAVAHLVVSLNRARAGSRRGGTLRCKL